MGKDTLIEQMLAAFFSHGGDAQRDLYRDNMRAALAVARKAILEEAAEKIIANSSMFYGHAKAPYLDCEKIIRSLNEAKPC